MKKIYRFTTLLFFMGIYLSVHAQNWQLINTKREAYFSHSSAQEMEYAIRIDSAMRVNDDSIYFNYAAMQGPKDFTSLESISTKSWFGIKIIKHVNGIYQFENKNHNYVIINSLANLNDTWKLFEFLGGNYIEAKVINSGSEVIAGLSVSDNVKTISLQAKNTSGSNINYPFNGKEIKWSEKYGIVQAYKLLDFPDSTNVISISGLTNPNYGIKNLTARDIYSFNVGDEFHLEKYESGPYTNGRKKIENIRKKIISIKESVNKDTVIYKDSVLNVYQEFIASSGVLDTVYIKENRMVEEKFVFSELTYLNYLPYEYYEVSNSSSGIIWQTFDTDKNRLIKYTVPARKMNDSILQFSTDAGKTSFIEGLGGAFYKNIGLGDFIYKPVYYKKESVEWGTAIEFSSLGICTSECIWPGDANKDGIANDFDIFPIGQGYNTKGEVRANASENWRAQQTPGDWTGSTSEGVNFKYADCNGNGTIDINDLNSIIKNYGLSHNKNDGVNGGPGDPALYFKLPDTVIAGTTVSIPIFLGTDTLHANDAYAIAFSIEYNSSLVDSGSVKVNFSPSWFGTVGGEMIGMYKDFHNKGKVDIGITRINQQNISAYGQVAEMIIVMEDDISGKDEIEKKFQLSFSNTLLKDKGGKIKEINAQENSMIVESTGIKRLDRISSCVNIYPNPTSQNSSVILNNNIKVYEYRLNDLHGKTVMLAKGLFIHRIDLNIDELVPGVYFLTLCSADGIVNKKIIKLEK